MATPILWHFAISHFTEKARWALDFKRIPHVRKMLFVEYPVRVFLRTGQMSLPVLFWNHRAICDSTRIIARLEAECPEPPLYPENEALRRRALEIEDFFDEQVGPHIRAQLVDRIFASGAACTAETFGMGTGPARKRLLRTAFPLFRPFYEMRHHMNPASIARAAEKVSAGLDRLEEEIGPSGYLVGDRFSVADLTAAALLYPIAFPPEYPYAFPEASAEVRERFASPLRNRRATSWVLEMYRRHRGVSAAVAG